MTWDAYRVANPELAEMRAYNKLVQDHVVLGEKTEFTDRYKAMGIPYPDAKTMCKGPCEGTGVVPIKGEGWEQKQGVGGLVSMGGPSSMNVEYQKRWQAAEEKEATDDGWHFVKCADCNGSGKRTTEESLKTCIEELRELVG